MPTAADARWPDHGGSTSTAPDTDAGADFADFGVEPARVLFLWDHLGYPGGATHGLTRYCLNVLPRLHGEGVHLTACFLREPHPAGEELRRQGVEPVFLDRRKWDPRALPDVLRLIRHHDIEVVHAVGQKGILVGRTAARIAGRAAIIHLRDLFPLNPVLRAAMRLGAGWTDVAQGVSRAVCDYATDYYRVPASRVELLYNGVLFEQFAPLRPHESERWRRAHRLPVSAPLVGVVGRLSPEKGHRRLFRQFRRVRARHPDAVLAVIGHGPLDAALRAAVRELGLERAVRFLGQQDDARSAIGALDVLAVPSDHEGLSFVALEALMLGTPLVGTGRGGLAEVVDHGAYGLLFSPDDEDSLGDALVRVLAEPEAARTRTRAAREHLRRFDMGHHVRRQREIYLRLARQIRGRRAPQPTAA